MERVHARRERAVHHHSALRLEPVIGAAILRRFDSSALEVTSRLSEGPAKTELKRRARAELPIRQLSIDRHLHLSLHVSPLARGFQLENREDVTRHGS